MLSHSFSLHPKYFPGIVGIAMLAMALTGCGSSGGENRNGQTDVDTEAQVDAKGRLALIMTDAVTDHYTEVWVTLTSATLIDGVDAEGNSLANVSLFSGEKTVDLLSMANVSEILLMSGDIQAGTYNKLRLMVSDITLTRRDAEGNVVETQKPNIVANGKVDLLARGGITLLEGQTTLVSIDFDAEKSLHLSASGPNGRPVFRPVVFIESSTIPATLALKPVRIHGTLNTNVTSEGALTLCQTRIADSSEQDLCVGVQLSGEARVFDESGQQIEPSELAAGQAVSVFGSLSLATQSEASAPALQVTSQWVQAGQAEAVVTLRGVNETTLQSGLLTDLLLDFQLTADGSLLDLSLHENAVVYQHDGTLASLAAITAGATVQTFAVQPPEGRPIVTAVFVEDSASLDLEGTINSVDAQNAVFNMASASGDVCVAVDGATQIDLLTEIDGAASLLEAAFVTLEAGQTVEVAAQAQVDGCYQATSVVITE